MKLLGYDYSILYKKGKEIIAADALSRKGESIQMCSISGLRSSLLDEVKSSWLTDPQLQSLIQSIQAAKCSKPYYQYTAGVLSRKGKLIVGADTTLRKKLIAYFHESSLGGHSGINATLSG